MPKKIVTKEWLIEQQRCGVKYWDQWVGEVRSLSILDAVKLLITKDRYDWGNWLIVQGMTRKQCVKYAVYAAKQVLDVYEKKYPNDERPREAINAALRCIKNDTEEKRKAAAGAAARAAARAARAAAEAAARAAARAARAAAAGAAAEAARAAAEAARAAAEAAAWAAAEAAAWAAAEAAAEAAAWAAMQKKILHYGIKLLKS